MSRNDILEEFLGHRAKQLVGELIRYHRVVASTDLTEAARYVASMSQQVGLTEVELKGIQWMDAQNGGPGEPPTSGLQKEQSFVCSLQKT